jgi:hypothetical protein
MKIFNKYRLEIRTVSIIILIGLVALIIDYLQKNIWH